MSINKRFLTSGKPVYDLRYRGSNGRQYKRTFQTSKEAKTFEADLRVSQTNGTWIDPKNSKFTMRAYSTNWLKSRLNLRIRTVELYQGLLAHQILPYFGDVELGKLSTGSIRNWYATLLNTGLAQSTVAKAYRLLRTIYNSAIEDGLVKINPCSIKGAGIAKSPERPIASIEEVFLLADAIESKYRLTILLATFGGLRLGEILALKRQSFDLVNLSVNVCCQLQELSDGRYYVEKPKTEAGSRTVMLPKFMEAEINRHLENYVSFGCDSLIFTTGSDTPLRRGVLFRAWKSSRAKVGMEHLHFHDLRHTGNTFAASTGASTAELMARMGHSSSEAALRYQHASKERDIVLASKLNSMVAGRFGNLESNALT